MDSQADEVNSELLDSFRKQWISDLQSRKDHSGTSARHTESSSSASASASASRPPTRRQNDPPSPKHTRRPPAVVEDDEGYLQGQSFDGPSEASEYAVADPAGKTVERKLVSALDHYEEAMEKEAQGNMGESLRLYRKAYRLDNQVDRRYREKHFPGGITAPKANRQQPATTSAAQKPGDASAGPPDEAQPLTTDELIASFSHLRIEPAPPAIEGTPPPPCPIAHLPDELLVHILSDVAAADVGDLARVALACKRLAYLVATDQRMWRRVCLGSEFGFSAMHRHFQRGIEWEALEGGQEGAGEGEGESEGKDGGLLVSMRELQLRRRRAEALLLTKSLTPSVYRTWKHMFRSRPRVRFNGCYISTVNYVRSGQASTNQATWGGTPIHIVTYYRFLRFFRDGSAISLLTTSPPADVVAHLTPELLLLHRDAHHHAHLPSAVMNQALRGRWRQSSILGDDDDDDDGDDDAQDSNSGPQGLTTTAAAAARRRGTPEEQEADLYVETEGVGPKYMYRMDLSLRSAGKAARNNKIVWRGFYSYNKLTADWAEFQLKNDKPFFFSRVKSYGLGV